MTADEHWVALVRGADRPGTLTALTSVFSSRGVSFDSLSTGSVDAGSGTIAVTFCASERRRTQLLRTVARLAEVRDVQVRRADDPLVRAAAVVELPEGVRPPQVSGVLWAAGSGAGGAALAEGSLAAVRSAVSAALAAGATTTATVVLGL
ncbi:ACT domain-containing protein [Isoptericola sp. b441]|uniref:ACT domain-containing protein n=1 Tax=Actinotalea lenta TaxID=3064654 RepID=A0ABT9D6S6_9CELL|nr:MULTISPECIES: ACT domain-containing protein [unclassified Isoptericola]MDO8106086.1 ACT domain-containing protein [Isoptericola sp. b441]MDO8122195.1 ACT domain-containing protein [Isoptericola sp. b490]